MLHLRPLDVEKTGEKALNLDLSFTLLKYKLVYNFKFI